MLFRFISAFLVFIYMIAFKSIIVYFRLSVFLLYQWQITRKISDCSQLKVNFQKNIYLYVNSTTQRCPNKIFKLFLIEDFFPFATHVNDTGGAPGVANISKKYQTALMGYPGAWGKLIHEKNLKSKISWHCPF